MSKQDRVDGKCMTVVGETSDADKGVFFCDVLMIGIFSWNQICYGMDMMFLIIPLILIGIWIAIYAWVPEKYCFTDAALEITHRFRRPLRIPYAKVFNYEASTRDTFINILQKNAVKVYYCTAAEKKRVVICTPRDVQTFTEALKAKCPELYSEEPDSSLQVFFNKKYNKGD